MSMKIPILAYHQVEHGVGWGINRVSPRMFERQIAYLAAEGYQSIRLIDFLDDRITCAKPVIITFDDADESAHRIAYPILRKHGFRAVLFVITDFVGRRNHWDYHFGGAYRMHLDWGQIQELAEAEWEIGSHSATHPDLTRLNENALYNELVSSRRILEDRVGRACIAISYPFNRFDDRVIKAVTETGYQGGFCLSVPRKITENHVRFTIPRSGVYAVDGLTGFRMKLNDHWFEHAKQRFISFFANGTVNFNRLKKILQF